jgi:hypothetical protein
MRPRQTVDFFVAPRSEERSMPSAALYSCLTDRVPRLTEIDSQCAASMAQVPPNLHLREENLRGYIVLLSAHFQGYCRTLYAESSQVVVSKVRPSLQNLIQSQFAANCALDRGNPNLQNLKKDFERFEFTLNPAVSDPANLFRLQQLNELNRWRNIAAHHGVVPSTGLSSLAELRVWRDSCDGLAASLDRIMYDRLRKILKRAPWRP